MKKEKEKQKEKPISIEQRYADLISLLNSMDCMRNTGSKVDMYLNIAAKFTDLGDYEEAKTYVEECNKLARQTDEEIKKNYYKKAENLRNIAKSAKDYRKAAEGYYEAGDYSDADNKALECEKISNQIENNQIKNTLIKRGVVILALLAAIIISLLPFARYSVANICMSVKSFNTAIKIYNRLDNYKESEDKIIESYYMIGRELEKEGNYKDAQKAYVAAKGYKDSEMKEVNIVKLLISKSEAGNTIKFGACDWILLDKNQNSALLIKKTGLQEIAYNESYTDVTWETSSIRQYLNTEFLTNTFSDEEQKNILKTNVENNRETTFGVEGGNNTLDYIYLLSAEEAIQYKDFLKIIKNNSWLRSPGNTQSSGAFLMAKGIVMDYGYMVSSDKLTAHPVLWFNMK